MAGGSVAWLLLAAAVQLAWGFYPAALRFMQTNAPHTLTSLQLSFLINAWALPVMLLHHASGLARAGCRRCRRRLRRRAPPNKPRTAAAAAPPAGPEALATPLLDAEAQQAASGPRPAPLPAGLPTKCRVLLSTTLALTTLMLAQIYALVFIEAWVSQMIFLLAPLLVSCLALCALRTPLPPRFWPALCLTLLGSGLVVGGKAEASKAGAHPSRGWAPGSTPAAAAVAAAAAAPVGSAGAPRAPAATPLPTLRPAALPGRGQLGLSQLGGAAGSSRGSVIGVGLSLLSALSLAAFMLTIQVAGSAVSHAEVLWSNFISQTLLALALTHTLERAAFPQLGRLLAWEWALVVGTSVSINWLANLLQQVTIRELGAPQVASFLPLRLVGSLLASYLVLGEALDSWAEGAGAAVVLCTLSWYLWVQKRAAEAQALEGMESEAEAGGAGQ